MRAGELAVDDGVLVHTSADGVRRWIPLTGPTAATEVTVSGSTGRAVLELSGAALDVTPREPAQLSELIQRLRAAGLRVRATASLLPPPTAPTLPSGMVGDSRWSGGLLLGALGGLATLTAARVGLAPLAVAPLTVATVLALAAAVSAAYTRLALRRAGG